VTSQRPFFGRSDVIAMPHIGASTAKAEENCAIMAADQMIDYLENGNIKNSINFPEVSMARWHSIFLVAACGMPIWLNR